MNNATRTKLQEVYFDLCDLRNGSTYKELSYDSKKEFLDIQIEKLEQLELSIFGESEE